MAGNKQVCRSACDRGARALCRLQLAQRQKEGKDKKAFTDKIHLALVEIELSFQLVAVGDG